MTNSFTRNKSLLFAGVFGLIHLVIDLVTVSSAFAVSRIFDVPLVVGISSIVLYDILAFAGQPIIGWLSDNNATYHRVALIGIIMVMLSVPMLMFQPVVGLVLTGIGNACFHVGAGALSLGATPGRATVPGIFVAPGAIGLGLGTVCGKSELYYTWPFIGALTVAFIAAMRTPVPQAVIVAKRKLLKVAHPTLVIAALLVSIAIRALVGFGGSSACKKTMAVKLSLMTVAFLGKGLGGIISDRIGWIKGSVGALLISAPLIAFFGDEPVALIAGFLFFQMTMPVTLVAVNETMPGRPGLAFGLCCLALLAGSLLAFSREVQSIYNSAFFFGLIIISATLVYFSLRHLSSKIPMKF
ncbi:MAG: hypothetical protein JXR76_16650 [Deltaproteobacteria bacterium]|nr:hypothetical protein [Deltaproteobacteria bacterium]